MLNQYNVFNNVLQERVPEIHYTINHIEYNMLQGDKRKLSSQHQEGGRKDIERAFGVLRSRFAIIHNLARS